MTLSSVEGYGIVEVAKEEYLDRLFRYIEPHRLLENNGDVFSEKCEAPLINPQSLLGFSNFSASISAAT